MGGGGASGGGDASVLGTPQELALFGTRLQVGRLRRLQDASGMLCSFNMRRCTECGHVAIGAGTHTDKWMPYVSSCIMASWDSVQQSL